MNVIVAVSGGMDSLVSLWHLLTTTDDEITAYHMILKSRHREGKWEAESIAMDAIIPWLRENTRPFTYFESVVEGRATTVVIVTREIARLVKEGSIPWPDLYVRGSRAGHDGQAAYNKRRRMALMEWKKLMAPSPPAFDYVVSGLTRRERWEKLPEFIRDHMASCVLPRKRDGRWKACGHCHTCREYRAEKLPLRP